jgi:hypothetical protein
MKLLEKAKDHWRCFPVHPQHASTVARDLAGSIAGYVCPEEASFSQRFPIPLIRNRRNDVPNNPAFGFERSQPSLRFFRPWGG